MTSRLKFSKFLKTFKTKAAVRLVKSSVFIEMTSTTILVEAKNLNLTCAFENSFHILHFHRSRNTHLIYAAQYLTAFVCGSVQYH